MATKPRYILLEDRIGNRHHGKRTVARGQILECSSESKQPEDPEQMALRVISTCTWWDTTLVCHKRYVAQITDSEADLLGPVFPPEESLRVYRDKNRLTEAKTFNIGSKVFVKLEDTDLELRGVIRYKGNLLLCIGTQFGVELLDKESEGCGDTDGTDILDGIRYFTCPADRGIFVEVDKLRPRQDQDQETEECVGQKSDRSLAELATSLDEERKTREEVERRLHSSEQRSHEFE